FLVLSSNTTLKRSAYRRRLIQGLPKASRISSTVTDSTPECVQHAPGPLWVRLVTQGAKVHHDPSEPPPLKSPPPPLKSLDELVSMLGDESMLVKASTISTAATAANGSNAGDWSVVTDGTLPVLPKRRMRAW